MTHEGWKNPLRVRTYSEGTPGGFRAGLRRLRGCLLDVPSAAEAVEPNATDARHSPDAVRQKRLFLLGINLRLVERREVHMVNADRKCRFHSDPAQ